MVRGIAVMRRRADSYVNATQILKVAGVDKGRRTKILEREILPGKHEIVQGGYGKYQGTWYVLFLVPADHVATSPHYVPNLARAYTRVVVSCTLYDNPTSLHHDCSYTRLQTCKTRRIYVVTIRHSARLILSYSSSTRPHN